ncbi:MAG TPA: ATP-binding cassette domain-containing protein, partial [Nitratidesulfovibrio sp.]|nr:ATP-binding cassette domain-containing protein [Nitratidesulfovibrio sp.]
MSDTPHTPDAVAPETPRRARDAHAHLPPVVRLDGICKSFGKVRANHDITLDIRPGCIKALLGENGAGKSTLMSILAGKLRQDSGSIIVDGAPTVFASPRDALRAGIGMVYQHFMLVDSMTVAENVLLGQSPHMVLRPARMRDEVAALAERYGLAVDPAARVGGLSMGERQRVEILKLLYRDSRVLILD